MIKKYNVKKLQCDKPNHNNQSNDIYHIIMNPEDDQYNILKNGFILLKKWVYYIDYTECNLNTHPFTFVEIFSDQYNCVNRNGEFLFKNAFRDYKCFENFTRITLDNGGTTLINPFGQILDTVFNETIYVTNDIVENINGGAKLGKIGVDFKFINNK